MSVPPDDNLPWSTVVQQKRKEKVTGKLPRLPYSKLFEPLPSLVSGHCDHCGH